MELRYKLIPHSRDYNAVFVHLYCWKTGPGQNVLYKKTFCATTNEWQAQTKVFRTGVSSKSIFGTAALLGS
eukprot:2815409-Rhodomonas_salina.2